MGGGLDQGGAGIFQGGVENFQGGGGNFPSGEIFRVGEISAVVSRVGANFQSRTGQFSRWGEFSANFMGAETISKFQIHQTQNLKEAGTVSEQWEFSKREGRGEDF